MGVGGGSVIEFERSRFLLFFLLIDQVGDSEDVVLSALGCEDDMPDGGFVGCHEDHGRFGCDEGRVLKDA